MDTGGNSRHTRCTRTQNGGARTWQWQRRLTDSFLIFLSTAVQCSARFQRNSQALLCGRWVFTPTGTQAYFLHHSSSHIFCSRSDETISSTSHCLSEFSSLTMRSWWSLEDSSFSLFWKRTATIKTLYDHTQKESCNSLQPRALRSHGFGCIEVSTIFTLNDAEATMQVEAFVVFYLILCAHRHVSGSVSGPIFLSGTGEFHYTTKWRW